MPTTTDDIKRHKYQTNPLVAHESDTRVRGIGFPAGLPWAFRHANGFFTFCRSRAKAELQFMYQYNVPEYHSFMFAHAREPNTPSEFRRWIGRKHRRV